MKLAVMQPYLFPYIGYFQLINAVDRFVIYDDVNFIKKGWINRNNILVNGKANLFTVPLKNASQNKLIRDIEISAIYDWKKDLLKTIELSYRKAPCYEEVFEFISRIINNVEINISGYIYHSLVQINRFLNIDTEIVRTSSIYKNRLLKQQNRIIDICKKENSGEYINPIGGLELYSKKLFRENEIDLYFIKTNKIVYRQFNNEFAGSLSIIDVMMFNPKERIKEFLNDYELI
ncbi:MAG TPA: WbqC family protein [Ignavibacteria bacterium]|nr:WbqC family protein [Ignavibacteria bacterium]